jgi:RNA polymerase sigma factor (sigma-70 family)
MPRITMVVSQKGLAVKDFQTLFSDGAIGGLSDAQLLDRFVDQREEAVFEAIIQRHGPMAWRVCRRVLRDHHDAEDAFQATFLVLARKAASVIPREKLGNWLYGVAYQTAMKARTMSSRRRAREKQVPDMPESEGVREDHRGDLLPLLDQELSRLPEKYRIPIVLCDLGGKTHKQAAEQLGWPVGTVSGRVSRAKSMLAERLTRRGVMLAAGSLVALASEGSASASVPLSLITTTSRAAMKFAAGQAAAGVVSASVAALTEGVLKTMLMTKLKIATALLLLVAFGTAGTRSFGRSRRAEASSPAKRTEEARPTAFDAQARGNTARRDENGPEEEMKKLEGTWAITDVVEGGIRATAEQKSKGLGRVVIKGDKMTVKTLGSSGAGTTHSFSVDPSKSPKLISLFLLNDKMEEDGNAPIRLGIYEYKGHTLTICIGPDRPENFEVAPGSNRDLLVLKWAKR